MPSAWKPRAPNLVGKSKNWNRSKKKSLSHTESKYISVRCESCESRGLPGAVNEMDLDGTPSFGAFQFKPGTFTGFREQYGLEPAELMDRDAQFETVVHMMRDHSVNFAGQFPGCTRLLGHPSRE